MFHDTHSGSYLIHVTFRHTDSIHRKYHLISFHQYVQSICVPIWLLSTYYRWIFLTIVPTSINTALYCKAIICWDSINTILTYVEILLNISKSFETLLHISEQYWTRVIISSHNFNKLKYITNKKHSITNLQLIHSYPQLALQMVMSNLFFSQQK